MSHQQPPFADVHEPLRRRFEAAWRSGIRPELARYVPDIGDPLFLSTLEELICVDLEFAWKAYVAAKGHETVNRPARLLESYVERYPVLVESGVLLRLAREECQVRIRCGDKADPQEYGRRFPSLIEAASTSLLEQGIDTDLEASPATTQRYDARGLAPIHRTLGDYELLEVIGRGGMGTVFRGRHCRLRRDVAIKLLSHEWARDHDAIARFDREMQAVGSLPPHPNVVLATDARFVDDEFFLVMEFVQGVNLVQLLRNKRTLPFGDACEIIRQATIGLAHVYQHGLVHRDLKPSNLLLTPTGIVKILDLGLARIGAANAADEELTRVGQLMGTPDYMAPEQWEDTSGVDIRADIYSLGCTLYRLLVGRAPYAPAKYGVGFEKRHAHLYEPIPDIREVRADVPAEIEVVLNRMLAKSPSARFADPAELLHSLEPWARGADLVRAYAQHVTGADDQDAPRGDTQACGDASTHNVAVVSPAPKRRWTTRTRNVFAMLGTALLIAVAACGVFGWRNGIRPDRDVRPAEETSVTSRHAVSVGEQKLARIERATLLVSRLRGREIERLEEFPLVRRGQQLEWHQPTALADQDGIGLSAQFDGSLFWYLLWFDTQGNMTIADYGSTASDSMCYPAPDQVMRLNPDDPEGLHMLVLAAGTLAPELGLQQLPQQLSELGPPVDEAIVALVRLRGPGKARPIQQTAGAAYLEKLDRQLPTALTQRLIIFLKSTAQ